MSQIVHTPGPLHVDGQNILANETEVGIAKIYGNIGQPRETNARLLSAAYNAFDSTAKKLGINAVEFAERMQDGGIADLVMALEWYAKNMTDHLDAKALYALAKVKGGAT